MPTLSPIRDIPAEIMQSLDEQAHAHGQSRESYIRGILYALARRDSLTWLNAFGIQLEPGVSLNLSKDDVLIISPQRKS